MNGQIMDYEFIQELSELEGPYGKASDGAIRKVSPILTPFIQNGLLHPNSV